MLYESWSLMFVCIFNEEFCSICHPILHHRSLLRLEDNGDEVLNPCPPPETELD